MHSFSNDNDDTFRKMQCVLYEKSKGYFSPQFGLVFSKGCFVSLVNRDSLEGHSPNCPVVFSFHLDLSQHSTLSLSQPVYFQRRVLLKASSESSSILALRLISEFMATLCLLIMMNEQHYFSLSTI